jgi:hypothetical protein
MPAVSTAAWFRWTRPSRFDGIKIIEPRLWSGMAHPDAQ